MTICKGCGIEIQSKNPKIVGYTKHGKDICQRCFEMIHYNKIPYTYRENSDYKKIILKIANEKAHVFMVVDIMNFENTFMNDYRDYIGNNNITIIVNKFDLFPKSCKKKKIINWVSCNTKENDIIVVSGKTKIGIDEIIEKIKIMGYQKNYFIGFANTGKSTIINQILKTKKQNIFTTTSYYPGTTLGKIEIKLDNNKTIIDTPGIIQEGNLLDILSTESYKIVIPKNEIKPRTYQLNEKQTLFISGFCQMNFISGNSSSFTIYASNYIHIHRRKYIGVDEFRENHLGKDVIVPPTKEELKNIKKFKEIELEITENKTDIVIANLGFICINKISSAIKISIIVPENIKITTRKSII